MYTEAVPKRQFTARSADRRNESGVERTVRSGTGSQPAPVDTISGGRAYTDTSPAKQSRMTNGRPGSGRTALMFPGPLSTNDLCIRTEAT